MSSGEYARTETGGYGLEQIMASTKWILRKVAGVRGMRAMDCAERNFAPLPWIATGRFGLALTRVALRGSPETANSQGSTGKNRGCRMTAFGAFWPTAKTASG